MELGSALSTAAAIAPAPRAMPARSAASLAEAQRIGREFEAMFLTQMLSPMFESLGTAGPFGGGPGEQMFRSLLVEEVGKGFARSGGIGIADQVAREVLRLQEASHG